MGHSPVPGIQDSTGTLVLPLWDIHVTSVLNDGVNDDWLFIPQDIPELETIQQEFLKIFNSFFKDRFAERSYDFWEIDPKMLKLFAPTYLRFLEQQNCLDILWTTSFSGSKGDGVRDCPIHIDSKIRDKGPGLCIPIIGCEDSWTIFYDIGDVEGKENGSRMTMKYEGSMEWKEDAATEVGRSPSNVPHWNNIFRPHTALTNHNDLRLLLCVRFKPELYDRRPGFFK